MTKRSVTLHIVIGPTASGKSEYAVTLAKKYNGEIISADSRQVYRGLDIGAGKVAGKWQKISLTTSPWPLTGKRDLTKVQQSRIKDKAFFVYKNIPHHCIDYISPKRQYSVANFKRDAEKAIQDILARGKSPIICGGTGQFVDAVLLNQTLPEVPPNLELRKKLEWKTPAELFALLKKKDPIRAATIDPHNPRRLIRALEIINATGRPVPNVEYKSDKSYTTYKTYGPGGQNGSRKLPIKIFYLNPPREELYKKIEKRLKARVEQGMVKEVQKLHESGVSWKRLDDFGLEYRYVAKFLRKAVKGRKGNKKGAMGAKQFLISEYYSVLLTEIKHYAKRQQTWFKKYIPYSKI